MQKGRQPISPILPWSLHKGLGWKSQFQRMERWHQRVMNAETKADLTDFLFAFFQNCYHFREWLESNSSIERGEINAFFNANPELGICKDICNVTKHYSLSIPPNQKFQVSFLQEFCPKEGWFGGDAKLLVITDNKNYDLRELAHQCLEIWKAFLKQHELLE